MVGRNCKPALQSLEQHVRKKCSQKGKKIFAFIFFGGKVASLKVARTKKKDKYANVSRNVKDAFMVVVPNTENCHFVYRTTRFKSLSQLLNLWY